MSVGNQVEKPRFFIDLLQYQYEIGNVGTVSDTNWASGEINAHILGLTATKAYESIGIGNFKVGFKNPISIPDKDMFIAILGHNFLLISTTSTFTTSTCSYLSRCSSSTYLKCSICLFLISRRFFIIIF